MDLTVVRFRSVAPLPSHLRDLIFVGDPDCFGSGIRTRSAMDLTVALIRGVAALPFYLPDLIIVHAPDSIRSAVEFGPFPMWNSDLLAVEFGPFWRWIGCAYS